MDPFSCGICLDRYSEEENRIPRTLTACGHTICEFCVWHILDNSKVACPFDRIVSNVPNEDIEELKKNFAILDAIRNLKSPKESGETPTEDADTPTEDADTPTEDADTPTEDDDTNEHQTERALGIPCAEDPTHISVFYCTNCTANFCERCSISLHSSNFFSSHKIIKVTEKPEPRKYCQIHPSNEIEYYCLEKDCSSAEKLMCRACSSARFHVNHKSEKIDIIFKEERIKLTVLLNTTNDKIKNLHSYIDEIEQLADCPENDQQYVNAKKNLDEIYNKYLTTLSNWNASKSAICLQQVQNQLDSKKQLKPGYDQRLQQLEIIQKTCQHAMKLGIFDYLEKMPSYSNLEELLSGIYVFPPVNIKLNRIVEPPSICEFSEIYKSTRKIIFLVHDSAVESYQNRLKNLGAFKDDFLDVLKWTHNDGTTILISFWNIKTMLSSDKTILENTTYVFTYSTFQFGTLSPSSTIIYRGLKKDMDLTASLIFGGNNLTIPVFCVTEFDDGLTEHVLRGNYQENSYFQLLKQDERKYYGN